MRQGEGLGGAALIAQSGDGSLLNTAPLPASSLGLYDEVLTATE